MHPYTFHINLYDLAFVGAIFIGLTFAVLLWVTKTVNRSANRFLTVALVTMILWMVRVLAIDLTLDTYLPLQFLLALGPLVYFYVLKITRPQYKFNRRDILHFSPVLLEMIAFVLEIGESAKTGAATWATHSFQLLNPVLQLLIFTSNITYLYLCNRLIQKFYRGLQPVLMDRSLLEFKWLRRLLGATAVLWLLWLGFAITNFIVYRNQPGVQGYYPFYIFFVVIIIWTAAAAFLKPQAAIMVQAVSPVKQPVPAELRAKGAWLKKAMETNLYYEDPELSVSLLAEKLGIPAYELSRIINTALKKNFSDFINEYRVRQVARKMQDPAYDQVTLLGIAYESGFNSKTTFNRTFRQMTGKSPLEYKNDLEKERPISKMEPYYQTWPVVLRRETAFKRPPEKINRMAMFRTHFKIAWRNTLRSISTSSINMIGLAAGLSSFIVILLYMNYELSYDKWSPELSKVYKVSLRQDEDFLKVTPGPLADFLAQNYPEAQAATKLQWMGDNELLIAAGENKLYQKNVVNADSNFLRVFPFKLASGNAATALNAPKTAILTTGLSHKLFGNEDPVGKLLRIANKTDVMVTGMLEDVTEATHLPVSMLVHDPYGRHDNTWDNYSYQTYIKLRQPENDAAIERAINRLYYNERLKQDGISFENYIKAGAKTNLFVDQVPRIHNFPKHGSSNFATVTILLVLAMLLLLAGAINFSNLAIAQSISRAKEVGIRKVMGSGRKQLILQFMAETALQCFTSLVIAVILLAVALPYINRSFNISIGFLQQNEMLRVALQLAGCLLIVILLSGLYPAFYLSKFNAVKVLKGNYSTGGQGKLLRNSLIVVQFMVSVFFITGIIVIKSQMSFMYTKDKGFSDEQVMRINATFESRENGFDNARNILLSVPGVVSVAKTTKVPGDNRRYVNIYLQKQWQILPHVIGKGKHRLF